MNYLHLLLNLYHQKRNLGKSRERLNTLQQKKLRKLFRYAYNNSEYYRKAFEAEGITGENLDRMPLQKFPKLDKEQLMEHFDELVTNKELKQERLLHFDESSADNSELYLGKYHVVHSSGSTGKPKYFIYDDKAWDEMLVGIVRGALWGMTMSEILKLLAEKPRILYIAATAGRYGGAMAVGDGIRGVRAEQFFLDINTPLTKWIAAIKEFHPNIIIGYPSAIKMLAEQPGVEEEVTGIRRLISCGEPLSTGLRGYLEKTFRAPVMNFYGASESLALGVEPSSVEGMYLFDDLNIIEVEDGEMYLTCLYNFTQPLIRYHITDQLILREKRPNDRCAFTKSDVLLCRNEDVLWFEPEGGHREFLHPLSIEGFCVEGLRDYQFRQLSRDSFQMLAEVTDTKLEELVQREVMTQLERLLAENGLAGVKFSVRFVERIQPNPATGKKPLILRDETVNYDNRTSDGKAM